MVDSILDKKGSDILLLDLREQAIFTDYFLLCNGDSDRQLQALAEGITETAKKVGDVLPWGVEGDAESGWVLVDYGDIIIHIFSPEKRAYYNLEELWSHARIVLRIQ
ncbi:MAG: ribosome silencing factor [Anaerolineales bacterium]|nr:ribosome silencing factor [Anaerolineales bacterium]